MTLGNHEFDDGVKGLVPFLQNQVVIPCIGPRLCEMILNIPPQTVPFVVSNINTSQTPDLDNLYQPSVVLEVTTLQYVFPLIFYPQYGVRENNQIYSIYIAQEHNMP